MSKRFVVLGLIVATATATATAQPAPTEPPTPPVMPNPTPAQPMQPGMQPGQVIPPNPPAPDEGKPKEPKAGDFNAGGQARFPNGPDAMGMFKTWNWVAFDVKGQYFLLPTVTANFNMPLAIIKPDMIVVHRKDGDHTIAPRLFGGASVRLDAKLPKLPNMPFLKMDKNELGISLQLGGMKDGAALLSEKDYPLFTGDIYPSFTGALIVKVKLSEVVDFRLLPAWVWQKEGSGSLTAFQMPMTLVVGLGNLIKLSTDLSIYTGDNYSLRPSNGGRLGAGIALDVKIGPILAHAGTGFASLLTSYFGEYQTISDSIYFDVNVKYAK